MPNFSKSSEPLASSRDVRPLGFGLVGMGGYAQHVLRCLQNSEAEENPPVSLKAICDPDVARFAPEMEKLRSVGLTVYTDVQDLLADARVEAVWLPVPIMLHRPFTLAALEAGKAVLCEKPAAATVDEVNEMIAARDRRGHVVAVGFQDIYDPLVQEAKRRILAGELGKISTASVWGVWPRDSAYYSRNGWAGAVARNGQWILDSPASNAMAHFITLLLYLLGPTQQTAAVPASIEAELYRANDIENYDTCGLRVITEDGVSILILFTHAGQTECPPELVVSGQRGTLAFGGRKSMTWTVDGQAHTTPRTEPYSNMIRSFSRLVAGDQLAPVATLEIARQHVIVINGASEAATPRTVPEDCCQILRTADGGTLRAITDIESTFAGCAKLNKLPHESRLCKWSHPAAGIDLKNYNHFSGPPVD